MAFLHRLVQAVHAEESLLDAKGDVDVARARGIAYGCGAVRERPTYKFDVDDLRRAIRRDHSMAYGKKA